jgi:hypothetical protein
MKQRFKFILLFVLLPLLGWTQTTPSNIGSAPTNGTGEGLRSASSKYNTNDFLLGAKGTATGIDTYSVTINVPSPGYTTGISPITSYVTGQEYTITFTNGNTGPSTLNVNGIGAKSIVKAGSTPLVAGDIPDGQTLKLVYNGTNLKVIGVFGASSFSSISGEPDDNANLSAALDGKVSTATTVNGHALSSNVTITKEDVNLGSADNTSDLDKPVSNAQNVINVDLENQIGSAQLNDPTLTTLVTRVTSDAGTTEATQSLYDYSQQLERIGMLTKFPFLLTPNSVKANKVYSVKPVDGNGDITTFARTSTANRIGSAGTITSVATGVPRIDYTDITPVFVLEPAATNLIVSPSAPVTQGITVAASVHTLTFYGTGTVTLSGVSSAGPLVGTGANNRVSLTFTPTAGTLTLTIAGTVTNAQLEARNYATTYQDGTRNVESMTLSGLDSKSFVGATSGTWFVHIKGNSSKIRGGAGNLFALRNSVTGDYFRFVYTSGGSRLQLIKSVTASTTTLFTTATDEFKCAIVWNGTTADVYLNGVKSIAATTVVSQAYNTLEVLAANGAIRIAATGLSSQAITENEAIDLTDLTGTSNHYMREATLYGLSTALGTTITAFDNVVSAAGKLQNQATTNTASIAVLYGRDVFPEDYASAGDGTTDDFIGLGSYFTQASSGTNKSIMKARRATYMTSGALTITGTPTIRFSPGVIKRTAASTATPIVTMTLGTAGIVETDINVDGNSANANTVVGINITAGSNNTKSVHTLSALECDTGIKLEGNVEKINLNTYLRSNVIGFNIHNDGTSNTVDEAKINITGADNDTHFLATGTEKISYDVHFNVEQADDPTKYAIDIQNGDGTIGGEVRGCAGGGVSITTAGALSIIFDNLVLYGVQTGSALQAALVDAQNSLIQGTLTLPQWNNGVWLKQCKTGSAFDIKKRDTGATGTGLRVGDFANSKEISTVTLLPSVLFGTTNALHLDYATNCTFNIEQILEGGITISANSSNNTINLSKGLRNRAVTNNRTQDDNRIFYKGFFTNTEIEEITTPCNGMRLENVTDVSVRDTIIYYLESTSRWTSSNGLEYDSITNTWE